MNKLPVERILVVTAHPDDVDFGAAGTVANWTDAGVDVTYCLVTSGDAGGKDRSESFESRAALRETEQTNAAKVVGVSDLYFLRYPDGSVESTLELRRDISRVIRTVRPQRVLTQSPERNYDRIYASHPDHLAVGDAAVAAVYPDSRNPFAHPALLDDEGLEPWSVPELWLMAGGDIPEHAREVIDITDNLDRKIAALRCHESQTADRDDLEELIRNWTAASAESAGLPSDRHAEIFRSVDTR